MRTAGKRLGQAVSYAVRLLNPKLVIVSGSLAQNNEHLLTGVRESVYRNALPLATRDLMVVAGREDHHSGVTGAARLAISRALSPERVNAHLRTLLE